MTIDIQWPLVLFTVVAGMGAGVLVAAGAMQLLDKKADAKVQFVATAVSLALLAVGGCFSLLHLAVPGNVMAAVYNIGSFSGISLELITLGIIFILAAVFAILQKRESEGALKVVAVLGVVSALLFMYFSGHGYVLESRPAWNTEMLPLAYLGTALASGVFAYGLVLAFAKGEESDFCAFKKMALVAGVVCAVCCAAYAVFLVGAVEVLPTIAFWGGLVLFGIVGALGVGVFAGMKLEPANAKALMAGGFVVDLIAVFAVRVVMWQTSDCFLDLFATAVQLTAIL